MDGSYSASTVWAGASSVVDQLGDTESYSTTPIPMMPPVKRLVKVMSNRVKNWFSRTFGEGCLLD
jgi:hypothetical protein